MLAEENRITGLEANTCTYINEHFEDNQESESIKPCLKLRESNNKYFENVPFRSVICR